MSGVKTGLIIAATITVMIVIFCLFAYTVEQAVDNSAAAYYAQADIVRAEAELVMTTAIGNQMNAGTAAIAADTAAAHDKARQFTTTGAVVALCVALLVGAVVAAVVTYNEQRRQIEGLTATINYLVASISDMSRQGGDNV